MVGTTSLKGSDAEESYTLAVSLTIITPTITATLSTDVNNPDNIDSDGAFKRGK